MFVIYIGVLMYALWREDKSMLRNLPHFIWVGTIIMILLFLAHYRHWVKEALIQEMVYSRDGISGDLDNSALNRYRRQFRIFDSDLNGAISVQELMRVMERHGRVIRKRELMQRLNVIDDADDKEISFTEFVNLMEGLKSMQRQPSSVRRSQKCVLFIRVLVNKYANIATRPP